MRYRSLLIFFALILGLVLICWSDNYIFLNITYIFLSIYILVQTLFYVEKAIEKTTYRERFLIMYAQLKHKKDVLSQGIRRIGRTKKILSKKVWSEIMNDILRHNSFNYINNGSLPTAYFRKAYATLGDEFIYIVITDSGSASSELISAFTDRRYNHVSLSFDRELKTIISYNGGEKISPPGLNYEMLEHFNQKSSASMIVYRLRSTSDQKRTIIDKIRQINAEGSAYNLLGLVFKYSHRPNIMFCSQFVYKMLACANLAYFEREPTHVKPTDFVELDYYRKLEFVYEVIFNETSAKNELSDQHVTAS